MSEKKLRILFVGNSYTYYNKMPQTFFADEAERAGYDVEVAEITRGGYRLCQFADPENEEGKRLREAVLDRSFDCAVLQEQSLNPIKNEEEFLSGVGKVKALIEADRFVLYATWGRNDGSTNLEELGLTRQEMTERLSLAYNKAGGLYGMSVAEVGKAFLEYSLDHNKDDLYNPDKSHPSAVGSEIAARVIFDKVIEKAPR